MVEQTLEEKLALMDIEELNYKERKNILDEQKARAKMEYEQRCREIFEATLTLKEQHYDRMREISSGSMLWKWIKNRFE